MSDYDRVTAFLGEWGPFQQHVFFLLCLNVLPNGFSSLAIVFVADVPPHRCLIPAHFNLTAEWRNSSIPLEEEENLSRCSRYKLDDIQKYSERGLLPGVDVNLSNVAQEGCLDGWEYDQSVYISTIVTEWNLVCDNRWKKPLTSSLYFFGVLIGSFISGQLADSYGRKIVLVLTMGVQAVFTLIQVFSPSWVVFCIMFFFVGVGQCSTYLAVFVLGTETLGSHVRTVFTTAGVSLFFAMGYMLLPLFAFFLRGWRGLLLGLASPYIILVPLLWFIPESPRWLLSQGRLQEAEAIIKKAAKRNNIEPPEVIFTPLQPDPGTLVSLWELERECQSEKRKAHNICDLLRSSNIRWISVTLWLVWNSLTIAYYALSLNTSNLHGNAYFNCFLSGLVEIPAYTLTWLLFRRCSRRLCLSSSLFMGGFFLLIVQLIPANLVSLAIATEMLGKFGVTVAFAVVYAYTAEVYPTVVRNTAMGACSMASRIGSIIAPYFIYLRSYSVSLPYILIGSLTVLASLLSLLLPESYGMPLPDTITHMQPFPGCCQKFHHKFKHFPQEENPPTRKSQDVSGTESSSCIV